jgi:hypothetical protein
MAVTFIEYSKSTEQGGRVSSHLASVRAGRDGLTADLAVFQSMLSGDGSSIAHFDLAVKKYGFGGWVSDNEVTNDQRTAAKASWDELNSVSFKLNSPSGTGDSTGAAINQACAKHGV